jgi:hypothetical protein
MGQPRIVDRQGQEKDWAWLVAQFGPVELERAGVAQGNVYRVVEIREVQGPAVQVVNVVDPGGTPIEGIRVVRFWPDAPLLPDWPPPTSLWRNRGVFGDTNVEGNIGYGMGQGDYYYLPASGASAVWVGDESGPSDLISGLGMLGGTARRHLDLVFQLQPAEPPPESSEERWQRLFARLDQIIAMLEQ